MITWLENSVFFLYWERVHNNSSSWLVFSSLFLPSSEELKADTAFLLCSFTVYHRIIGNRTESWKQPLDNLFQSILIQIKLFYKCKKS